MASNPGHIPAGGKDKISVVVHTKNRGGRFIRKRFSVHTNDPTRPWVYLVVTGQVKGFVDISPTRIQFMGRAGDAMRQVIRITPIKDYPFTIKNIKAREGKYLAYELKPKGMDPTRNGYQLIVTNTMEKAGSYTDLITIETDIEKKPKLIIPVRGRIHKAPKNRN